jgi:hypothetical protein
MGNYNDNNNSRFDKFFSEKTALIILRISACFFAVCIFVFLYFGDWQFSTTLSEEKIGQFGDFIGGVIGSILALVGIILYYIALREQRKDIKINQEALNQQIKALNQQIEEFQEQKKELAESRKVYEKQSKTMEIQQFESNFYSFFNIYLKIKQELVDYCKTDEKDFFKEKYNILKGKCSINDDTSHLNCHNKTQEAFRSVYLDDRGHFSQYFKTIYRLIKIIDLSNLTDNEKRRYCKIVRSQISDYELLILYYNYHSEFGKNVQSLVLNYNLLKHIPLLSKIEFCKKFSYDADKINILVTFTERLFFLLKENVNKASDIESDPVDISESFEEYNINISVKIDTDLIIECCFNKDTDKNVFPFEEEIFKTFIEQLLFNTFFYSRFSVPKGSEIESSRIEKNNKIIFSYKIESTNINKIIEDKC